MPQILPLTARQAKAGPTQNPEAPKKVVRLMDIRMGPTADTTAVRSTTRPV
jgi:hypothetical protein